MQDINTQRAIKIIKKLRIYTKNMPEPLTFQISKQFWHNPFLILISCLLSLRARDTQTAKVCSILFKKAQTPEQLLKIPRGELEKIIYPLGFYRKKTQLLYDVCHELIQRFQGQVPADRQDLLSIKGVGNKTANLVLGVAFGVPAICVDTHVHRISNHLGLVKTKTPAQTEAALERILPKKYWIEFNKLLVAWGQHGCTPRIKHCKCRQLLDC